MFSSLQQMTPTECARCPGHQAACWGAGWDYAGLDTALS